MRTRCLAAILILTAVAACSSSGKSHGQNSTSAAALAAKLQHSIAGIHTAELSLDTTFAGQKITGSGPATFADGVLSGLDVTATVPTVGKLHVRLVGEKSYAQLPLLLNSTGKPWVLVSSDSSNSVIAQLGSVLDEIRAAAGLNSLVTLVKAAKTLSDKGQQTVQGSAATHYVFTGNANALTDLWVDSTGRPVQAKRTVKALGQQVAVTIGTSAFNQPVTITAPPASDVGTP